jgi:hypothetical protein
MSAKVFLVFGNLGTRPIPDAGRNRVRPSRAGPEELRVGARHRAHVPVR